MAEYMVLDVNATLRRVALLDRLGGHHVTLAPEALPAPGEFLHGSHPARGVNVMSASATGQVYRMIFEAIDCGQQASLDRLHPAFRADEETAAPAARSTQRFVAARSTDTWDGVVPSERSSVRSRP